MVRGEHPSNLSHIAPEPQYRVTVVGKPRPLGFVLAPRIPQKRIPHGCIGPLDVAWNDVWRRRAYIESGEPIVDHGYGVQSSGPPGYLRGSEAYNRMKGRVPVLNILL